MATMSKGKIGFVREATGLVREIGLLDSISLNAGAVGLTSGFITTTLALTVFPAANMPLSIIITSLILAVGLLLVYPLFGASMPRSGGDFIFVGRTLHPSLGLGGSFTQLWSNMALVGYSSVFAVSYLANALVATGLVASNSELVSIGALITTPFWTVLIGSIMLITFGVLAFVGTRPLMVVIDALFIILIATVAISLVVLFSYNPSGFVATFNSFMLPYSHNPDTYHQILSATSQAGFTVPTHWTWTDTLLAIPFNVFWLAYTFWATYMGGEIKRASSVRRQCLASGVTTIFLGLLAAGLVYGVQRAAGSAFVSSVFYAYSNLPKVLPIPTAPYYNVFIGMITGNAVLTLVTGLGFVCGGLLLTAIAYPMLSRLLFAYSFDRLIPMKFSEVNQRFGSPQWGIIVSAGLGVVMLAVYAFVTPVLFVYASLGSAYIADTADFILVALAGILFPYLAKNIYALSPIKNMKIGPVPIISLAGVIALGTVVFGAIQYWTNPAYGVSTLPLYEIFLWSTFIIPVVAYFGISAYRKRQGINLGLLFTELPPE